MAHALDVGWEPEHILAATALDGAREGDGARAHKAERRAAVARGGDGLPDEDRGLLCHERRAVGTVDDGHAADNGAERVRGRQRRGRAPGGGGEACKLAGDSGHEVLERRVGRGGRVHPDGAAVGGAPPAPLDGLDAGHQQRRPRLPQTDAVAEPPAHDC